MFEPNFQTVVLEKGRHQSPLEGACVVELASMLSGERFSDHPASVCRVIAAFLRAYNDVVDDDGRQDLYRCAAAIVGTKATAPVQRRRIDHCLTVLDEVAAPRPNRWLHRLLACPTSPARLRELVASDPVSLTDLDQFAFGLASSLRRTGAAGHRRALALVDELVALGRRDEPAERPRHAREVAAR